MTWPDTGIDRHSIHGSLSDLAHLATVVEKKVAALVQGGTARIREEFAVAAEYTLVLDLRDDGFDPSSADPSLTAPNN